MLVSAVGWDVDLSLLSFPQPSPARTGLGVGVQSVQKVPVTRLNKNKRLGRSQRDFSRKNSEFLPILMRAERKEARNRLLWLPLEVTVPRSENHLQVLAE